METEKDPVDLFPAEPTDEGASRAEETLKPWASRDSSALNKKTQVKPESFCLMRKMGLEPTRLQ